MWVASAPLLSPFLHLRLYPYPSLDFLSPFPFLTGAYPFPLQSSFLSRPLAIAYMDGVFRPHPTLHRPLPVRRPSPPNRFRFGRRALGTAANPGHAKASTDNLFIASPHPVGSSRRGSPEESAVHSLCRALEESAARLSGGLADGRELVECMLEATLSSCSPGDSLGNPSSSISKRWPLLHRPQAHDLKPQTIALEARPPSASHTGLVEKSA